MSSQTNPNSSSHGRGRAPPQPPRQELPHQQLHPRGTTVFDPSQPLLMHKSLQVFTNYVSLYTFINDPGHEITQSQARDYAQRGLPPDALAYQDPRLQRGIREVMDINFNHHWRLISIVWLDPPPKSSPQVVRPNDFPRLLFVMEMDFPTSAASSDAAAAKANMGAPDRSGQTSNLPVTAELEARRFRSLSISTGIQRYANINQTQSPTPAVVVQQSPPPPPQPREEEEVDNIVDNTMRREPTLVRFRSSSIPARYERPGAGEEEDEWMDSDAETETEVDVRSAAHSRSYSDGDLGPSF